MTTATYPNRTAGRKAPRIIPDFDVISHGDVFHHTDIVMASVVCHETGGRLYRVIPKAGTPHGFLRIPTEPLPEDIAKRCSNRMPRKPEPVLRCVPVWR